ncbi:MAG: Rho termination factor N-terminal domain-containing protein [Acidimicrobiales bacterium]
MATTTTSDDTPRGTDEQRRLPGADLVDRGLDRIEDGLPALPAAVLRIQRSVGERIVDQSRHALCVVGDAVSSTVSVGRNAARTVTGTARHAREESADVATVGMRRTVGQARAQTARTADAARAGGATVADELRDLAEETVSATTDVADEVAATTAAAVQGTPMSYDHWTKKDLYDLAQDLDIDGRSTMNKDELIAAIERTR